MPPKDKKGDKAKKVGHRISKWYPGDDVKTHFVRKKQSPKAIKVEEINCSRINFNCSCWKIQGQESRLLKIIKIWIIISNRTT